MRIMHIHYPRLAIGLQQIESLSTRTKLTLPVIYVVLVLMSITGKTLNSASVDHPCQRPCVTDEQSMRCFYNFHVETYTTMSKACYQCPMNVNDCSRPQCIVANGVERNVVVVNRRLPGPSIQVCQYDEIVVDVVNNALSQSTSIHWHGFSQMETPFMDGVPLVTQCPIPSSTSFRYKFVAANVGTYLWHGHSEFQKADGMFGALIVKQPNDPQASLYDHDLAEHVLLITDWTSQETDKVFVENHQSNGTNHPDTILVNGRGSKYSDLLKEPPHQHRESESADLRQIFSVENGKRYRFRLISSGIYNCPIQVSIEKHSMLVIGADGFPVEPHAVTSLIIFSGERYDFVLEANATIDNYSMTLEGLLDCSLSAKFQTAIIRYKGASTLKTTPRMDLSGTKSSPDQLNENNQFVMSLNSTDPDDVCLTRDPDFQSFLTFDFYLINNPLYNDERFYPMDKVTRAMRRTLPLFNHIAFLLSSSPLLTQLASIPEQEICNDTTVEKNCTEQYCSCTYVLNVNLGDIVELIFIDEGVAYRGMVSHPIHLHGQHFRVVAMQTFPHPITKEFVEKIIQNGTVFRKLHRPVIKDTVNVPQAGFTIIRFHAINAGFWLLHCHMDFHMQTGMALVIKVGDEKDFVKTPKDFPKCGNYIPPV